MITGTVNDNLHAIINIRLRGPQGDECDVEAILDTGFNGYVTLPPSVIGTLRLPRLGFGRVQVADGSERVVDFYEAVVIWEGQPRSVEADAVSMTALVGTGLIENYHVHLHMVPGGLVTIQAAP